jgi:hypothetical protein
VTRAMVQKMSGAIDGTAQPSAIDRPGPETQNLSGKNIFSPFYTFSPGDL